MRGNPSADNPRPLPLGRAGATVSDADAAPFFRLKCGSSAQRRN